ncbi:hypothetical protein AXY46_03250 [Achromobacter xylosoxidans]|nr:hypothetical protein AXY46_03250 [Achromobacter xylosoxidans]
MAENAPRSIKRSAAKAVYDDTPASIPQTTPTAVGFGSHDHSFTLQAIIDLKASMVELRTSFDAVKASVDSTKSKVDDLINWKNRILGGAVVLGVVSAFLGFVIAKGSDYVTFKQPTAYSPAPVVAPSAAPQPLQQPSSQRPSQS